ARGAAARARIDRPAGRRDRGARRRQCDAPDQPHREAGVPSGAAARRGGLHAVRQLVELPPPQARRGPPARRGGTGRDLLLPRRATRGIRGPAPLQPPPRPRRHGDGPRRRPDARPLRLPHDLRGARLRPLLPERARRGQALDGGFRRPAARLDSRRVGDDEEGSTCAARDAVMRIANAPVSYGAFELTLGVLTNVPGPEDFLDAIAAAGYEGTELGPLGYFGDAPTLRWRLERPGPELAGAFIELRFGDGDFSALDATLDLLEQVAAAPVLADKGPRDGDVDLDSVARAVDHPRR